MNVKFIKLRLNLDKQPDRNAFDILENADKSYSKFIISAINACGDRLSKENENQEFIRKMTETIRQELRNILGFALSGQLVQPATQIPQVDEKENAEIADDFLENFN